MRAGIECRISLAKKLPITLGGLQTLSFDLGTFANTSARYILAQNPSTGLYEMPGPFGSNVLATRNIGGDVYGLFENQIQSRSELNNTYLPYAGGNTAADAIIPNYYGVHSARRIYVSGSTTLAQFYPHYGEFSTASNVTLVCYIKKVDTRYILIEMKDQVTKNAQVTFNLDTLTGVVSIGGANVTATALPMTENFIALIITCDAAFSTSVRSWVQILNDSGGTAVTTESYYFLPFELYIDTAYPFMPRKATDQSSNDIKSPDIFYWANATLPAWLKGSTNNAFSFNFIPNHSSVQHAAKGTDTFLFNVDGTENVECYIAGADQKLYIDVDSVNKFTSASAFAWDMHDTPKVTLIPNNGSNCRVITSGFNSGNADETGTTISMQDDGDLYWAMRHTTNDLQLDGLQSEPRAGMV